MYRLRRSCVSLATGSGELLGKRSIPAAYENTWHGEIPESCGLQLVRLSTCKTPDCPAFSGSNVLKLQLFRLSSEKNGAKPYELGQEVKRASSDENSVCLCPKGKV